MSKLTAAELKLLHALTNRQTLKSHRDIDGGKVYQLHSLDGSIEMVPREVVEDLYGHGLIETNQKFPAATYWLTDAGRDQLQPQSSSN